MKQHVLLMAESAHHEDDACPDDGVIEGTAERISDEPERLDVETQMAGDTPFFLVIELADRPLEGNVGIDLDTPWLTTHAEYLRLPATWWLVHKATQAPILAVVIEPGDQPYFVKHHVGNLMAGSEVIAYGMGKKCADGTMVRLWVLPNGFVCGGEDADILAARMME